MFEGKKIRLAMSALTWGTMEMEGVDKVEASAKQMMDEVRLAGFEGIEAGMGFAFNAPLRLKHDLDLRGLVIPSLWYSGTLITEAYDVVEQKFRHYMDVLDLLGIKIINFCEQSYSVQGKLDKAVIRDRYVMNDDEWEKLTVGLNKLGAIANERGFRITYHHHGGTVVMTEPDIERLMENTDPDKVWLLLDTGHLLLAGGDPYRVARKYAGRIGNVHMKDYRKPVLDEVIGQNYSFGIALRSGVFTVPGDGDFDFGGLFAILEENGYEGWLIVESEQDPDKYDPMEYALKTRKYLHDQLGF